MIKRQYRRFDFGSYFNNFIAYHNATNPDGDIAEALKPYKATLGKSKYKNTHLCLNVKWHDPKQYTIFVLKWS